MKYVLNEISESGSVTKRVFDDYASMKKYADQKGMTLAEGPSPAVIKQVADTLIMRMLTTKIEDIPAALDRPLKIGVK